MKQVLGVAASVPSSRICGCSSRYFLAAQKIFGGAVNEMCEYVCGGMEGYKEGLCGTTPTIYLDCEIKSITSANTRPNEPGRSSPHVACTCTSRCEGATRREGFSSAAARSREAERHSVGSIQKRLRMS